MIKYYILTGLAANGMHQILFGSYELEDVRFEKEAEKEHIDWFHENDMASRYKALRIHKLECDRQSTINAKLLELNKAQLAKQFPKQGLHSENIISINCR